MCSLIGLGMISDDNPEYHSGGYFWLAIGLGIFGLIVWSRRRYDTAQRKQRQLREEQWAAWLASRPASMLASSDDPQQTALALTARQGGGAFLGATEYDDWVTANREHAVLVLGPPRSGKTSSLIIPAILTASGPVVSTSTKGEVMEATCRLRSRLGRVWLFDPSGTETRVDGVLELQWSPVRAARTWDGARTMADAMVSASAMGESGTDSVHWTESAKSLLGPMLHAAALAALGIGDVRRWVLREDYETPGRILEAAIRTGDSGAALAADEMYRVSQTADRERSSVVSTTRNVLAAYGSESALAGSAAPNFDADAFVRSTDTVYITAPSHLQGMLAPIVVGLLEEIRDAAFRLARTVGSGQEPARPFVFWALDEIANIAPIKKLPSIVSEGGGQGVQVMACFQDLSQAEVRWGKAADGFLSLFGTKVIFPGIGDRRTVEALSIMVGDWDRPYAAISDSYTYGTNNAWGWGPGGASDSRGSHNSQTTQTTYSVQREALLTPSEVANIPAGHTLLVHGRGWSVVKCQPYFAPPWTVLRERQPAQVVDQGGTDDVRITPMIDLTATFPAASPILAADEPSRREQR